MSPFVRYSLARLGIFVINADGSGEELLASCEDPCNSFGYPDWNADGTRIYWSATGQGAPALVCCDAKS